MKVKNRVLLIVLIAMFAVLAFALMACTVEIGVGMRNQPTVTGVTVNPTTHTLTTVGATVDIVATVTVLHGAATTVTWKNSNPSAVSYIVNGNTITITAIANGTANITATSTINNGQHAISVITVNIAPPTPTVILTPISVNINDANLTASVNITGTATGAVTLNTANLPAGVEATVSGTTITVTGVQPNTQNACINDAFTATVTRQGINQTLTVNVNLTTTWVPDTQPTSYNAFNINNNVITGLTAYGLTLTQIVMPNSVVGIGGWAFYSSTALTSITIPASVTYIGVGAFANTASLISITVDTGNTNFVSIGGVLYNVSVTTLIAAPGGIISVTIPNTVINIGDFAFRSARALTTVTFEAGSNLQNIGVGAFDNATSLISITIPNTVIYIGTSAFSYATSLTSITIPHSVIYIFWSVFLGWTNAQTIYIQTHTSAPMGWSPVWLAGTANVVWGVCPITGEPPCDCNNQNDPQPTSYNAFNIAGVAFAHIAH